MTKHWEDRALDAVMVLAAWPLIVLEKLRLPFWARMCAFPVAMLASLVTAPITFPIVILVGFPTLIVATLRDMGES